MAAKKARSKRKSRTEDVSSASSSDNESITSPPPKSVSKKVKATELTSPSSSDVEDEHTATRQSAVTKQPINAQQAFEDFYLRQATREFANDLDKLRNASDFNARSVPILIDALKQGTSCLTKDERARIGGAASADS